MRKYERTRRREVPGREIVVAILVRVQGLDQGRGAARARATAVTDQDLATILEDVKDHVTDPGPVTILVDITNPIVGQDRATILEDITDLTIDQDRATILDDVTTLGKGEIRHRGRETEE